MWLVVFVGECLFDFFDCVLGGGFVVDFGEFLV